MNNFIEIQTYTITEDEAHLTGNRLLNTAHIVDARLNYPEPGYAILYIVRNDAFIVRTDSLLEALGLPVRGS